MGDTPYAPSPEHLALFARIVRDVARSGRLTPQDQDDFVQSAHVKLLERNYDIFRRFGGRSSMSTYLSVVARRMLLDWRNAAMGKWRPSATARTMGPTATALERLIHRDGHLRSEAVEVLRSQGHSESPASLLSLANRLPCRRPFRLVFDDDLMTGAPVAFEDPIAAAERQRSERLVGRALSRALRDLPSDDVSLLRLRFRDGQTIRGIAERLHVDPAVLYRRMANSLRVLRASLTASGVTSARTQ
jgi:RNA polymerase sigma factor (sigma-70 family)